MSESFEELMKRKQERLAGKKKEPKKRKRLKPKSKKQRLRDEEYQALHKEYFSLPHNRRCALCGTSEALSIHHTEKRGDNQNKTETWVTLCLLNNQFTKYKFPEANHSHSGGCHGFVEGNKEWARKNGFLK